MVNTAHGSRHRGSSNSLSERKTDSAEHPSGLSNKILVTPEPPGQAAPLMHETKASSLFRRQSHHECTLSHRSPRGRRSCELNQHASIRAWTRLALHRNAGYCVVRDNSVDRHTRMADGQGFQPLVMLPVSYCRPPPPHTRANDWARCSPGNGPSQARRPQLYCTPRLDFG